MARYLGGIGLCIAVLVLAVGASTTLAAGKRARDTKIIGEITAVSADEKTVTVAQGKKGKGADQSIKLDEKTVVEYVGIENQDEKKLLKGYFVTAVIGEGGTASALSVQKTAPARK